MLECPQYRIGRMLGNSLTTSKWPLIKAGPYTVRDCPLTLNKCTLKESRPPQCGLFLGTGAELSACHGEGRSFGQEWNPSFWEQGQGILPGLVWLSAAWPHFGNLLLARQAVLTLGGRENSVWPHSWNRGKGVSFSGIVPLGILPV